MEYKSTTLSSVIWNMLWSKARHSKTSPQQNYIIVFLYSNVYKKTEILKHRKDGRFARLKIWNIGSFLSYLEESGSILLSWTRWLYRPIWTSMDQYRPIWTLPQQSSVFKVWSKQVYNIYRIPKNSQQLIIWAKLCLFDSIACNNN